MQTIPPSKLLDRYLSKAEARDEIEAAVPLLQEVVNYGLALFARSSVRPEGRDENLAILLPYHHLLEMVDGIEILVAEAAPIPARLQLRSAFEALLTIEYITQADTVRRAYAYLVADIHGRLAFYRSLNPSAPDNLDKKIQGDGYGQFTRPKPVPDLASRIANLETLLTKTGWAEAEAEFRTTRERNKGRRPAWYQLYGGPRNTEKLAAAVQPNRSGQYALLYREWSLTTHAADVPRQLGTGPDDQPVVARLRDPSELALVVTFAVCFATDAIRCVLRHYRPDEERRYAAWYLNEINDVLRRFSG